MSKLRIFTTTAITLALAFGIWTFAAVNFTDTSSSFTDGEVLQASDLNALFSSINTNFQDAETQINQNETDIGSNDTDISNLQANTVAKDGDAMSGRLEISGDTGASTATPDGTAAALVAENTNASGVSAFIRNQSDQPALYVKQLGSGPILEATNGSDGIRIENDGSIVLQGSTVKNASGDPLLPVAYGEVAPTGALAIGTSNVTNVTKTGTGDYQIEFDASVAISSSPVVSVSSYSGSPGEIEIAAYSADTANNAIDVVITDPTGTGKDSFFSFIVQRP